MPPWVQYGRSRPRCQSTNPQHGTGSEQRPRAKLNYGTAAVVSILLAYSLTAHSALAITAEVAKKCGALTDKAYPLRVPGNPAAGRRQGTAQEIRNYFNKCVANGNMGEQAPKQENK